MICFLQLLRPAIRVCVPTFAAGREYKPHPHFRPTPIPAVLVDTSFSASPFDAKAQRCEGSQRRKEGMPFSTCITWRIFAALRQNRINVSHHWRPRRVDLVLTRLEGIFIVPLAFPFFLTGHPTHISPTGWFDRSGRSPIATSHGFSRPIQYNSRSLAPHFLR